MVFCAVKKTKTGAMLFEVNGLRFMTSNRRTDVFFWVLYLERLMIGIFRAGAFWYPHVDTRARRLLDYIIPQSLRSTDLTENWVRIEDAWPNEPFTYNYSSLHYKSESSIPSCRMALCCCSAAISWVSVVRSVRL